MAESDKVVTRLMLSNVYMYQDKEQFYLTVMAPGNICMMFKVPAHKVKAVRAVLQKDGQADYECANISEQEGKEEFFYNMLNIADFLAARIDWDKELGEESKEEPSPSILSKELGDVLK